MQNVMPFTYSKSVLPVLPKPDHAKGGIAENIPLSAIEDKELRKKLRNRQSALAARERKKARMLELEKQVAELQEANRRSEDENHYLRARLELVLRKCIRAGIPLEGENDLLYVRSPVNIAQTTRKPGIDDTLCASNFTCQQSQAQAQSRNVGTIQSLNEKNLSSGEGKCENNSAIRSLGEHQSEILQSLSCGILPSSHQPTSVKYHHASSNPAKCTIPIKQEILENVCQVRDVSFCDVYNTQTYCHENSYDVPRNSECDTPYKSDINQQEKSRLCKRDHCNVRPQTLPSIGAMLASPSKRARTDIPEENVSHSTRNNISNANHEIETKGMDVIESETLNREMKDDSVTNPLQFGNDNPVSVTKDQLVGFPSSYNDNNLGATLFLPQRNNFLETDFSDFLPGNEKEGNDVVTILDFQDIILGEDTADSPSSRSDSGLSMDDSLDWVTDNPIFDF